MRQFNVTVNGNSYQVVVEEVSGFAAPAPVMAPAPVAAPAAASAAAPAPVAAAPAAPAAPASVEGGEKVAAPMPGTIVDVKLAVGSAVKKGDVLMILEAMKMENEILSPVDGTVKQLLVSQGSSVNSGDVMAVVG
ncbi:MAG: biotin/lipoyl-containing protein [Candidatus Limiplasma sp.]|nr:biotin/lipoyl-containing protein [Candidatus Limiplasma sp.]